MTTKNTPQKYETREINLCMTLEEWDHLEELAQKYQAPLGPTLSAIIAQRVARDKNEAAAE
jgi:predicted nucleotidyltransferase